MEKGNLKAIAERKTPFEKDNNLCIEELCGSNYDDAYSEGIEVGIIYKSRGMVRYIEDRINVLRSQVSQLLSEKMDKQDFTPEANVLLGRIDELERML